jgi:hypothetical protein
MPSWFRIFAFCFVVLECNTCLALEGVQAGRFLVALGPATFARNDGYARLWRKFNAT